MPQRGHGERVVLGALAVSTAVLLLALLVQFASAPAPWAVPAGIIGVLHGLVPALAGVIALMRSRDDQAQATGWRMLGGSLFVIAAAMALRTFAFYQGLDGTWESLGTVGVLVGYPVAFTGLAKLASRRGDFGGNRIWLDALVLGLGVYAAGIALFSAAVASAPAPTDMSAATAQAVFVALDLFILALCFSVGSLFSWRLPRSWWLVMLAFVAFTLGDMVLLFLQTVANMHYPSLFEVPAAFFLLGLAAYADRGTPVPSGERRELRFSIPSLAVLAALAVLVWRPGGPFATIAVAAAAVAVAASVARITIAARDNRRLAEEYRLARTDDLTGLPNRRALIDREISADQRCGVIVIDIDQFKDVNSVFGLPSGDRLIVLIGQRLADHLRHPDALARLGGDEFAVLLDDASPGTAVEIAERLLETLESPFIVDGVPIRLTASAGVAMSDGRPGSVGALLREADVALYQAKADGPGIVRLSTGEAGGHSAQRLLRRSQLRTSLDAGGGDFVVHYQPVIRLQDNRVTSAEALVRWRDAGQLLGPGAFLPEIDRGGMMPALTRLVLRRSLSELARRGIALPVAVNVPAELVGDWLLKEVPDALLAAGVAPTQLTVEITEDALMRDPVAAGTALAQLRREGVRVLLDDFGTGWSGLSTLRDLAVDGIKVDRSFVVKAADDPSAWAIVDSVTSLARALGLAVVAEGAEDAHVVQVLRDLGVDYLQGYVAARPMPIEDLEAWLAAHATGVHV